MEWFRIPERFLATAANGQIFAKHILSDKIENRSRKEWLIENISIEIGRELNRRGLTLTTDGFLQSHGQELMRGIRDSRLANLHIMVDCE